MSNVSIEHVDDFWLVTSPYDEDFIVWAKEHDGRWRPGDKVWAFQDSDFTYTELRQELRLFYPRAF